MPAGELGAGGQGAGRGWGDNSYGLSKVASQPLDTQAQAFAVVETGMTLKQSMTAAQIQPKIVINTVVDFTISKKRQQI